VNYTKPKFQDIAYYSAPKAKPKLNSLDEVDPELLDTFKRLGISVDEQKKLANVAVDIVIDSVSVATTFKKTLGEKGIIFMPISEAIQEHPELVRKYLGTVVPTTDNFYAALNSAVFSDGSFCYIPKGVRCPMELSTYFRINEGGTGQFERTLVVADKGSYVSYLEGCTAPSRDENQLHAAVVELIAMDDAEIKYSTVQNWYPGNKEGKGGVYNFVTKRGLCETNAKISWTQVETGSAITWKYPSCILKGNNSIGEFYSIAVTNNYQQADTGTKMIHLGKNTKSTIISKGISAGKSQNSYRGLVQISPRAENARNFSQCDSLLMGNDCGAHTFPYIEVKNKSAQVEHEATTSKIGEEQLFYCNQRGIDTEKAIALIVNGFSKEVLNKLPMEFAVEAQKLLEISLEGSVG
jgi:Fe-S cluster assembly protein SufB